MKSRFNQLFSLAVIGLFFVFSEYSKGQSLEDHAKHQPGPLDSLQKTLDKNTSKMRGKKTQDQDTKMPMNSSSGMMSNMDQMMGQMMGKMPSNQASAPSSELPGFPGSSHIYHIGAKNFFLDFSGIIYLSNEQTAQLKRIKERSQESQVSSNQKIQKAEEDLWLLTASDRPDIKSIETKIKDIETLRGEKRINFIRDVGEAAGVLAEKQRIALLGKTPGKMEGM